MFRSAELGHGLTKEEYDAAEAELRPRLVQAQLAAADLGTPVCIVINGVDGAGKSEVVQHLMEWMDPRHIDVHALEKPTDEEKERPFYYRFWRRLPRKVRREALLEEGWDAAGPPEDAPDQHLASAEDARGVVRACRVDKQRLDRGMAPAYRLRHHAGQAASRRQSGPGPLLCCHRQACRRAHTLEDIDQRSAPGLTQTRPKTGGSAFVAISGAFEE